jgi:hypothetical protein
MRRGGSREAVDPDDDVRRLLDLGLGDISPQLLAGALIRERFHGVLSLPDAD